MKLREIQPNSLSRSRAIKRANAQKCKYPEGLEFSLLKGRLSFYCQKCFFFFLSSRIVLRGGALLIKTGEHNNKCRCFLEPGRSGGLVGSSS